MSNLTAIFPGSFDPLTKGHMDIISRSLKLFDSLVVGVLSNSEKNALFSTTERVSLIEKELEGYGDRVKVVNFSGLLVEFAKSMGSNIVVRGLRAISDYDYEAQMALMNRSLSPDIETCFLIAREENSYISSSIVKQVALLGGDVTPFLTPGIHKAVLAKLSAKN